MTQDELKRHFTYDSITGYFYRLDRPTKISGYRYSKGNKSGYVTISIGKCNLAAHRMAWLFVHGVLPTDTIDHINGDRSDNRIDNLRLITMSENLTNKVGKGFYMVGNRFRSELRLNGKKYSLGTFDTEEEAVRAYVAAKKKLHPLSSERLKTLDN
jgi:hypothetical protein